MAVNRSFWKGKRVFLTGHSGFKGGWLALWLADMGAEVHGYALDPPTTPSFFDVTGLHRRLTSNTISDIRNGEILAQAVRSAKPDVVFHLAAQPLVRYSYDAPLETYEINVMGTVNLLEAVRKVSSVKAVVNITSDKCYENQEWVWPYRENDPVGGYDPYSSSKGCAELVTAAYRQSFFHSAEVHIATARAGNVIGGGDWAADRLLPDFLRSLDSGEPLSIRSPEATRPWQHVLEPLAGYLALAQKLYAEGSGFSSAWNFGPNDSDTQTVQWIVESLCNQLPGATWCMENSEQPHEAHVLKLDSSKAMSQLDWQPRWDLTTALSKTITWHQSWQGGDDMLEFSLSQIHEYEMAIIQV